MAASRKLEKTAERGVYRRGSRYVVVWKDRGKQRKSFHATLSEAREAKRQRLGGDRRKRPRIRFAEYAETWIESYRGRTTGGLSETSRTEYRRSLNDWVLPFFGGFLLSEVEPPDVRDWYGWLEERGASVSTVRKSRAPLSALFATAKEDGVVRDNPVTGVRYVPSQAAEMPRKRRPLTLAELDRFMRALPERWRLLFLLLAHSGMRVGELLGLRWENVHLGDDPHLVIDGQMYRSCERKSLKSRNAYRSIPLSSEMARALQGWREQSPFPGGESPVFATTTGTPIAYASLHTRVLAPARAKAGIPANEVGGFHAFRRTLASLLHGGGHKTDRQLSDWLGHADPAFSVREYVGQLDEGLGNADFLDDVIPVDLGATRGQPATRRQPQTDSAETGTDRHVQAESTD